MTDVATWSGVVDCRSWEPAPAKAERLAKLAARAEAAGILVGESPAGGAALKSFTLTWTGPDDLSDALARVRELAGVDTSDFQRGHPRRV